MPQQRDPNKDKRGSERKAAERIYLQNGGNLRLTDIADELNVPDSRIRKWKSLDKWDEQLPADREEASGETAAKPSGKAGAPYGNQNAKGGRGNPHPNPPPDRTTHGGYRAVWADQLSKDEEELLAETPEDPEELLMDEIRLLTVRERRLLRAMNKYRSQDIKLEISDEIRREKKRSFADAAEEKSYKKCMEKKVLSGDRLPGEAYELEEHLMNTDLILIRLNQELSTVQGKIIKAAETLHKIRMEKRKMEQGMSGSEAIEEWITAVMAMSVHEK